MIWGGRDGMGEVMVWGGGDGMGRGDGVGR